MKRIDEKLAENEVPQYSTKVRSGLLARTAMKQRPTTQDAFGAPTVEDRIASYVSTIRQKRMELSDGTE